MTNRVRVNLANARELLELVGISESEVETIVRFRAEHGQIADGQQLSTVLGGRGRGLLDGRKDKGPRPAVVEPRAEICPASLQWPGCSHWGRSSRRSHPGH